MMTAFVESLYAILMNSPRENHVSADGPQTSPSPEFDFCAAAIVVTSPNLKSKPMLNAWFKQAEAERFVATSPLCLEVVYLLYVKFF